jgi:hypothetical protein
LLPQILTDIPNGTKYSKSLIPIIQTFPVRRLLAIGLLVVAICIFGNAYAVTSNLTMTSPVTVDMSGHQKSEIRVGEPVGFLSVVTNHGTNEKRFTYVVLILNQEKQIELQEGLSVSIGAGQSFTVAQSWIPKEPGSYTVRTFLLDGYLLASPLTDVIETQIVVK